LSYQLTDRKELIMTVSLAKVTPAPRDHSTEGSLRIMGLRREGVISRRTPAGVRVELRDHRVFDGAGFLDAPLIAIDKL
jgi:hypothetical protein